MSKKRDCYYYNVWSRGSLSTLVHVIAVVCKNCLVLSQVRSYVTRARHKSDLVREERFSC